MTVWRVERVTETHDLAVADLVEVEWFKENPEWTEQMARYKDIEATQGRAAADQESLKWPSVDEIIPARPGDEDATAIDGVGRLTLDITRGPELHPLDHVVLAVSLVAE